MKPKQIDVRKRVYNFYLENKEKGKIFTFNHFNAEKVPKSTVYDIIKRADNESGYQRRPGIDKKTVKMTKKKIEALKFVFDHQYTVPYSKISRKYRISKSYAHKIVKNKTAIKKKSKKKIPKRSDLQKSMAKTKCGRLYREFLEHDWVIDDESYFTLSHSTINGNKIFYTSNIYLCPSTVKFYEKAKYEPKLLVWVAISNKGMSKVLIRPSGLAINQKIYLEDCIKNRLMPFIEEHHQAHPFVFWPDLATSHYAKSIQGYLNEQNVIFVSKKDNPANVPEARPIEKFWSIIKGLVYKDGWKAENLEQLHTRISYCFKNLI